MTRRLLLAAGLAVVLLGACKGDPPSGPVAGDLTLTLTSPGNTDGAILVRVTGPIESVSGVGGLLVEGSQLSGGLWRIVVAGNVTSGPVARIRVPDVSVVDQYLAVVEQVAARGTFALLSTSGYAVEVVK